MNVFFVTAIFLLTSTAGDFGAKWDHFTFTQEWPQTACLMGKAEETTITESKPRKLSKGKKCYIPTFINSFIIHGLWPSAGSKEGPKDCSSVQFDMNKIKNLTDELLTAWPNIYSSTGRNDFWKHEWDTHGTCALSLNTTGTEYLFFRKTLDLMKIYNASRYLSKMNITPNDTTPYVTKTVQSVLQRKLGVMPNLQCYRSKLGYLLAEIRICMDKQFKLIECPTGESTLYWKRRAETEPCRGGKIYFPEIKRN